MPDSGDRVEDVSIEFDVVLKSRKCESPKGIAKQQGSVDKVRRLKWSVVECAVIYRSHKSTKNRSADQRMGAATTTESF